MAMKVKSLIKKVKEEVVKEEVKSKKLPYRYKDSDGKWAWKLK